MKNIEITITDNDKLLISVDLKQDYGFSKSGKSVIIGTTEGNISLPAPNEDVKIGLNVYRSREAEIN